MSRTVSDVRNEDSKAAHPVPLDSRHDDAVITHFTHSLEAQMITGPHTNKYVQLSVQTMYLSADQQTVMTVGRSSADVCGRGEYFWQKLKCLCLHISHLQWWASIVTATTVIHHGLGRTV